MSAEGVLRGEGLTLVPVPADLAGAVPTDATLARLSEQIGWPGLRTGRGWPHDDTVHALAFAGAGGATWLVVDDTGGVVGEVGTKAAPDDAGAVEIGYGLAGPSRGAGLGTRAVRVLLSALFADPRVRSIDAEVALGNLPSQRLLERLGFDCVDTDGGLVRYRLTHPG